MKKQPETVMEQLSLGNKAFADTRIKMDAMLNLLVNQLIEKDLVTGSVSLKIKVDMKTHVTDDGEIIYMPEIEPKISMKIGGSGSLDCFVPKGLVMKHGKDGKNIVCENQMSIDDIGKDRKGA